MVAERSFGMSAPTGELSYNTQDEEPALGLTQNRPGGHDWCQVAGPSGSTTGAMMWGTRSDNGHCQVHQSCQCSMLAAE